MKYTHRIHKRRLLKSPLLYYKINGFMKFVNTSVPTINKDGRDKSRPNDSSAQNKVGSPTGLMEQRSKDLSGVYKNPYILSSEKTDSATDTAISKRLIREILFEFVKKKRVFAVHNTESNRTLCKTLFI